jgi:hypothetical protein
MAKSKCMMFSPISANTRFSAPSPMFYIGKQVIENVNQWLLLGHMLTNDLDDTADITTDDVIVSLGKRTTCSVNSQHLIRLPLIVYSPPFVPVITVANFGICNVPLFGRHP